MTLRLDENVLGDCLKQVLVGSDDESVVSSAFPGSLNVCPERLGQLLPFKFFEATRTDGSVRPEVVTDVREGPLRVGEDFVSDEALRLGMETTEPAEGADDLPHEARACLRCVIHGVPKHRAYALHFPGHGAGRMRSDMPKARALEQPIEFFMRGASAAGPEELRNDRGDLRRYHLTLLPPVPPPGVGKGCRTGRLRLLASTDTMGAGFELKGP